MHWLSLGLSAVACADGEPWTLRADRAVLSADGRDSVRVDVEAAVWTDPQTWRSPPPLVLLEAPDGTRLVAVSPGRWSVRAGRRPGPVVIGEPSTEAVERAGHRGPAATPKPETGRSPLRMSLTVQTALEDRDRDGLPDVIELWSEEERAQFTRWFTMVAEAQFPRPDDDWARVHHDCAGLVRYAFREALKPHDEKWWARRRWGPNRGVRDVPGLRYPGLPVVNDLPFRRRSGAFEPSMGVDSQFTAAPSARTLWQHNTDLVSRSVDAARPGDLLFFRLVRGTHSRMHTMIALGPRAGADHRSPATRLVYHTGPTDDGPGQVRLVTFEALLNHPEPGWRPVPHNPRFLGVHRLRHLTARADRMWAISTRSL